VNSCCAPLTKLDEVGEMEIATGCETTTAAEADLVVSATLVAVTV
jgi:hypothetical protein